MTIAVRKCVFLLFLYDSEVWICHKKYKNKLNVVRWSVCVKTSDGLQFNECGWNIKLMTGMKKVHGDLI